MESVIKEEAKERGTTGILLEKCNKKLFRDKTNRFHKAAALQTFLLFRFEAISDRWEREEEECVVI